MRIARLIVPALLLCSQSALAQNLELRGLGRLGAEFGGDSVISISFTDGSTQNILAGQGVSLAAGVASEVVQLQEHAVDVELLVGLKFTSMVRTTNADLAWLRWPMELLVLYKFKPWNLRAGVGPTLHLGNHFEGSGVISGAVFDFAPAVGLVAQVDYTLGKNVGLELRYTRLAYARSGAPTVNASSIGFGFSYMFEIIPPPSTEQRSTPPVSSGSPSNP